MNGLRIRIVLVVMMLMVLCSSGFGQFRVEGVVRDSLTGDKMISAGIMEIGTSHGTISDIDGEFSFEVTSDTSQIEVSYTGYKSTILKASKNLIVKLSENNYFPSVSIIISAQQQEKRNSQTLSHLFNKELTRDFDVSMAPSLNQVAGVHMQSGTLSTNRIMIRGIGSRSPFATTKLRAYFNDIPLTSGDGETTLEDIDMSLIDHVEILKGPTSSEYGAGLGGMIHLKSKQGNSHKSYFQSDNTIGSYGLWRTSNTIRLSNKKGVHDFRLNINKTHNDGYRANNEYNRHGAGMIYNFVPNDDQIITVLANYIDVNAFIPSSLNVNDFESNPSLAAANWSSVMGNEDYKKGLLGISNQKVWKNLGASSDYSITNTSSFFGSFRDNYEVRPFNILDESSYNFGLRGKVELKNERYKAILYKIAVGIELFNENYKWSTLSNVPTAPEEILSDNEENRFYGNVFLNGELRRFGRLLVDFGVNINKTRYSYEDLFLANVDQSGDRSFDAVLSPRVGFNFQLTKRNNHYAYANISHGFSPISLEETLNPSGNINPNIKVEKGWNYEIGLKGHSNDWDYDLSIYTMNVTDLLVARRTAEDQFVGINAGKSTHQGIEGSLKYTKYQSYRWRVVPSVTYAYSHHRFDEFIDGDNDYSGNELTGVAPHNLNFVIDFLSHRGLYGNINYQYLSEMPMRDDNSLYSDSYQVANLKIGYQRKLNKTISFNINTGVRNVFNEKYASMILINASSFGGSQPRYYYPGLPRNIFANMSVKFDL